MDIAQNKELNKKKRFIKKFFPVFNPLKIKIVKDDKLAEYISNKIHERCFNCIRYCCYLYGFIAKEQYFDDTISRENSINTLYNICKLWHDIGDVFGLADRWKNNNLSEEEINIVQIFFGLERMMTAYEYLLEKNILACLQAISMFDITTGYEITAGEISDGIIFCRGVEQMQQQIEVFENEKKTRSRKASNSAKSKSTRPEKMREKIEVWNAAREILKEGTKHSFNSLATKIEHNFALAGKKTRTVRAYSDWLKEQEDIRNCVEKLEETTQS